MDFHSYQLLQTYIEHFNQVALDSSPLCSKVWYRCMDDVFVICRHPVHPQHLPGSRQQHTTISIWEESGKQIAFLNVLVKRHQSLHICLPKKKKNSHRQIFTHTTTPLQKYLGVIQTLNTQALSVCAPKGQQDVYFLMFKHSELDGKYSHIWL